MAGKAEKELQAMHSQLCKVLMKRLKSDDCTTQEMNVVRQFLKDNNIDALFDADTSGDFHDLVSEFADDFKKSVGRH